MRPGCAGAHLFAGKLHSIRLSAFRQQLRKHKTTIYCVSFTENTIYDGSFFLYLQAFPAFQSTRKLLKKIFSALSSPEHIFFYTVFYFPDIPVLSFRHYFCKKFYRNFCPDKNPVLSVLLRKKLSIFPDDLNLSRFPISIKFFQIYLLFCQKS